MYLVGEEITVTWVLGPTDSPLAESAYDIAITPSTLEGTYTDAGIINYVAPTAITAGSIQYAFTPASGGRFHLILSTGAAASYTVLEENDFWVFETSVGVAACIIVPGAISRPRAKILHSDTKEWGDIDWRNLRGFAEHPTNGDIYVVGWREFADTNGTLQIYTPSTGAFTNYITIPFTDPVACAVTPGGRVYVLKAGQEAGNVYPCYYSDSPYTSWTKVTNDSNAFSGSMDIHWDSVLDILWWGMGTQMQTAIEDATVFTYQNYDHPTFGELGVGGSTFWNRHNVNGGNWAYSGGDSLGGGLARFYVCNANSAPSAPVAYTTIVPVEDAWDAFASGPPTDSAMLPDASKVFMCGTTMQLVSTSSGNSWRVDEIDFATISGLTTFRHMFTIAAFGKMYIYGLKSATPEWWESSDGVTWAKSTDVRLTAYTMHSEQGQSTYRELSNGGFVWSNPVTPGFAYSLVHTF